MLEMQENVPFEKVKMPGISRIIMVASGKGGVGKSTVAAGIALSLANEGYSVGIMDADLYGPSLPTLFNIGQEHPETVVMDGKTRIKPFIRFGIKVMTICFFVSPETAMLWRGPMVSKTLKQLLGDTVWGDLDYLIIDTPPGTGDTHLTLLQQYEVSGAIIVTTPQKIALSDVRKAITMFQSPHFPVPVYGIVENMAWFSPTLHPEEKYYLFGQGGGEILSETFHVPLLARIPMNENICRSCDEGRLNELFNDPEVKKGFDQLLSRILSQTEKPA